MKAEKFTIRSPVGRLCYRVAPLQAFERSRREISRSVTDVGRLPVIDKTMPPFCKPLSSYSYYAKINFVTRHQTLYFFLIYRVFCNAAMDAIDLFSLFYVTMCMRSQNWTLDYGKIICCHYGFYCSLLFTNLPNMIEFEVDRQIILT